MSRNVLSPRLDTDPTPPLSEVTFHVAKPARSRPLQWVGGISVGGEDWWHEYASRQVVDRVTAHLPEPMAAGLLPFAAHYLQVKNRGPNAIDLSTDYCCHTLAKAVGSTALEIVSGCDPESTTVSRIFHAGSRIEPTELAAGEWAVVGHPSREGKPGGPVSHSMVGLGSIQGEKAAYDSPMAIQIDSGRGGLYIGSPDEYIQDEVRRWEEQGASVAPPGLYVKR